MYKKSTSLFIMLFILLLFLVSCKKRWYTVGIEPADEIGTVIALVRPAKLLSHPIIVENNLVKKSEKLSGDKIPEDVKTVINKTKTVRVFFSSTDGYEKLMVRVDGDFKKINWQKLLKGQVKKARMRGLKRNETFYKSENSGPSFIISPNKIILALQNQISKVRKKVNSKAWNKRLRKEFALPLLMKSLHNPLLLASYRPPPSPMKEADTTMKKELSGIPLYFPILSFKRVIVGLGENGNELHYFLGLEFTDSKDAQNVKGILLGSKSWFQLMAKKAKPVKNLIDQVMIVREGNLVGVTGSITPKDVDDLINFSKKQYISYKIAQKKKRAKWKSSYSDKNYKAEQAKHKREAKVLATKVLTAFSKKSYRRLYPLIAKRLKPKLNKAEFLKLAKKISQFGKIKDIKISYVSEYKGKLNPSVKVTFIKGQKESSRTGHFTFVKEGNKYKLLKFNFR